MQEHTNLVVNSSSSLLLLSNVTDTFIFQVLEKGRIESISCIK